MQGKPADNALVQSLAAPAEEDVDEFLSTAGVRVASPAVAAACALESIAGTATESLGPVEDAAALRQRETFGTQEQDEDEEEQHAEDKDKDGAEEKHLQ